MNTRVHKQIVLAIGAAVLMSSPLALQAKDKSGMDVCIDAFVAQQLPAGHPLKVVKRDVSANPWNFSQASTIAVSAKGRRSGTSYGSAVCTVNRDGELVAMEVREERSRYAKNEVTEQEPRG